jgi:transmembrane sensor
MNYSLYTVEDLLADESFINYCLLKNPEDVLVWEDILTAHPELAENAGQAKKLLFLLSVKASPAEKTAELNRLRAKIEGDEQSLDDAPGKRSGIIRKLSWISAAAAVLICIGGYFFFDQKDYSTTVPVYDVQNLNTAIKTKYNERKSITLADGSVVLMNGLTTLKIDENYGKHNRVLWLTGEAHFTVAKNKEKPFIVISRKTSTTALGTSFKINNYDAALPVSIMLTTGKVNIGKVTGQKIENRASLLPGEKMEVSEQDGKFSKSAFDITEVRNWTERKLTFSMASLKEIRTVLKNLYGVEIIISNQPKSPIAFTGEFHNQSLSEVLDAIGFSNHFSYTLNNDKVILDFKK